MTITTRGGDGADNDGVDERFQQRDDSFADRFVRLGGRVGDRRRSDAGFVAEHRSLDPDHQHAQESTVGGIRRECLANDRRHRIGNRAVVADQNVERAP